MKPPDCRSLFRYDSPTRMKSNALNIDSATGLKTPANVPSVRPVRSTSEIPNSTYPSDPDAEVCVVGSLELRPSIAPNRRNIRKLEPAIGNVSLAASLFVLFIVNVDDACIVK